MLDRVNAFLPTAGPNGRAGLLRPARNQRCRLGRDDLARVAHAACPPRQTAGPTIREFARANFRSTNPFLLLIVRSVERPCPQKKAHAPTASPQYGGRMLFRPTAGKLQRKRTHRTSAFRRTPDLHWRAPSSVLHESQGGEWRINQLLIGPLQRFRYANYPLTRDRHAHKRV